MLNQYFLVISAIIYINDNISSYEIWPTIVRQGTVKLVERFGEYKKMAPLVGSYCRFMQNSAIERKSIGHSSSPWTMLLSRWMLSCTIKLSILYSPSMEWKTSRLPSNKYFIVIIINNYYYCYYYNHYYYYVYYYYYHLLLLLL